MANLLANGDLWGYFDSAPPIPYWTGTAFQTVPDPGIGLQYSMKYHGAPAPGDVYAGAVQFSIETPPANAHVVFRSAEGGFLGSVEIVDGAASFSFDATLGVSISIELDTGEGFVLITGYDYDLTITPTAVDTVSYNCECEDDYPARRTLVELRHDLARRLGYGAQVENLPPGMTELLNSFLQGAQRALYRRYSVLRTERIFRWPLVEGVRFYDLDGNDDACTKRLDPRKVRWVGIERDGVWTPLVCGIPPEAYSYPQIGWPTRYEIRQCIEIWPAPDSTVQYLRVKGHFELEPFTEDDHATTIDDELVFLLALANAKAHYNKPDANNYIAQLETMMANLVAGSHHTRRYIPGQRVRAPTPEPVWTDGQWPPIP